MRIQPETDSAGPRAVAPASSEAGQNASPEALSEPMVSLAGDAFQFAPAEAGRPGPRTPTLRRNFVWTLAGNAVYAGCQWAMLMVLAKLTTAEDVGRFSLGLSVTAPVIIFAMLQLRAVQATDSRQEFRFGDYLALRLITMLLALLAVAGITLASGYRGETALVIVAMGIAKAFEAVSDIFYGLLQRHEVMSRIAISMMIKGPLSLALLGLGVIVTHSVLWGAVGLAFSWALLLFSYDVRSGIWVMRSMARGGEEQRRSVWPIWDWPVLLRLAWYSLPLGIALSLSSLNTNIPRYFVEHRMGERGLGIFTPTAYLMTLGTMIIMALGQSATPRLANHYAAGEHSAFRALLIKLLAVSVTLGAIGVMIAMAAGKQILTILYKPEYARDTDVLVLVMAASGLWYVASSLGYAATARRRIRYQPVALAAAAATSFVACYFLVPAHGLLGAGLSMVASAAMGLVGNALLLLTKES